MKHLKLLFTISLFWVLMTQEGIAQEQFRSLQEFNYDTMAYMKGNYDPYHKYTRNKSLKDLLSDAEIPFKSHVIGAHKDGEIFFILLFTQSAEEVRALYQAGKPVYGVFCSFGMESFFHPQNPNHEIKNLHAALSRLGTNRFNPLDENAQKELQKLTISWAWFYDQKGWLSMYRVR